MISSISTMSSSNRINHQSILIQPFNKPLKKQNFQIKIKEFQTEIKVIFNLKKWNQEPLSGLGKDAVSGSTMNQSKWNASSSDPSSYIGSADARLSDSGDTVSGNNASGNAIRQSTYGHSDLGATYDTFISTRKLINCQSLFRKCKEICLLNGKHELKKLLLDEACNDYLKNVLHELESIVAKDHDQKNSNQSGSAENNAMKHLLYQWRCFKDILSTLSHVLLYLDKTYLVTKGTNIQNIGKELWKDMILLHPSLSNHWKKLVMDGIEFIRNIDNHVIVDQDVPMHDQEMNQYHTKYITMNSLLKNIFDMWRELNLYYVNEKLVLDQTQSYYSRYCTTIIQKINLSESHLATANYQKYLHTVCEIIERECSKCKEVANGFLAESTKRVLEHALEDVLISNHVEFFLKGFPLLLDAGLEASQKIDNDENQFILDLHILYTHFERVKKLDQLRAKFAEMVKQVGLDMIKDDTKDDEMVESLLRFQKSLDYLQIKAFQSSEKFQQAQKESFSSFINQRQNKPAELIALYVDKIMKSGKISETEIEHQLDGCLRLFRLVQGKDVFEAFYGKTLAKRLLLGKSASIDAEKSMLDRLKSECGAGFTSKLEGMFKDMVLSREVMASLNENRRWKEKRDESGMEVNVSVLTSVYWPTYPQIALVLPIEFTRCQEAFKEFYTSHYNGRKISWAMSLGHCQVTLAHEKAGNKDLIVSLFQTIALLLFNTNSSLTTSQVQQLTGMDAEDTGRTLLSLSLGKVKILKKNPHVKQVLPTDTWSLNPSFTHPQRRIVVNTIQATESPQEVIQTRERVFEDRAFAVDAAIVRIMKTKKKLSFRSLVTEVFEMLKFPMELSDLKKRIESLVERDYLERDEHDPTVYNYMA